VIAPSSLRKQFLQWRSLSLSRMMEYLQENKRLLQPVAWSFPAAMRLL